MKIQIIKGVYGHKENGVTVPKDKNSAPFEIADAQALKLIKAGIAEKFNGLKSEADKPIKYSESLAPVDTTKVKTENTSDDTENTGSDSEVSGEDEDIENESEISYSMKNTQKELLAMAKSLGFDGNDNTAKAQLIEFLDEATAGEAPQIGEDAGVVG